MHFFMMINKISGWNNVGIHTQFINNKRKKKFLKTSDNLIINVWHHFIFEIYTNTQLNIIMYPDSYSYKYILSHWQLFIKCVKCSSNLDFTLDLLWVIVLRVAHTSFTSVCGTYLNEIWLRRYFNFVFVGIST